MLNLEVYLNAEVTSVLTVDEAIRDLGENKYDIVIALEMIDREEAGLAIQQFMKVSGRKNFLLIPSAFSNAVISDNVFSISGKYDIKKILQFCSNLLGITAKQMANQDVGNFYPISIQSLLVLDTAPCNIYTIINKKELLYKKNDPINISVIESLKSKIQKIHVSSNDRLIVINEISKKLVDNILSAIKNVETENLITQIGSLNDGYEFTAANLFLNDEASQSVQEIASASAKIMATVANEVNSLKSLLTILTSNKDGYIFSHSILTSYVAGHLNKQMNWGSEGQLEKINFVLFFHDIYLAPIYQKFPDLKNERDLLEDNRLTDKEKDIVLNHAKLAAELVLEFKRCPMGVEILIRQHHGVKKGRGFANVYVEDISPISKIIIVAERFVELFFSTNDKNNGFVLTLAILRLEFKSNSYAKIVENLTTLKI
jgi:HD-GYP domain-containing protein (c-di-GMP phosphodiesterase class II)